MESGKLRHLVVIERPEEIRGPNGGTSIRYVDWLTVRAEVLPLSAREQWTAQQVASETDVRIRMRYRPGITAKHRLRHLKTPGSPSVYDRYDIAGEPIDVRGRRKELEIMCVKRDAEGFRSGEPYSDAAVVTPPDDDLSWSADSTLVTADSTIYTADAS